MVPKDGQMSIISVTTGGAQVSLWQAPESAGEAPQQLLLADKDGLLSLCECERTRWLMIRLLDNSTTVGA